MPIELMSAIDEANATSSSANYLLAEEDASLVAAAKAMDARAFELLVERHERKILSMAQRITRNREDAEDVVQQSFQKAFIHLKKFEGDSLFSTWLTRIAINEALMLLRRKRAAREVPIAESTTKDEAVLPPDFPELGCRNFCSTVFAVPNVSEGNSANHEITPGYASKQSLAG